MAAPASLGGALARAWRATAWYARGLTGESRYESYLAHERVEHPERPPTSRPEFWRAYHAWQDDNPQGRCC
jgi:uncharacterized short protein YbdD (DUF466 family)